MQENQPNNNQYDFILNSENKKKKTFGGDSTKKRIIMSVLIGGVFLVLAMIALTILRNAGKEKFNHDAKIVQLQNKIIQASETASRTSDSLDTRTLAATLSASVINDNAALISYLKKNAPNDFLKNVPTTDKDTDSKLKKAISDNNFDNGYLELVNSFVTDYMKELRLSRGDSPSTTKLKLINNSLNHIEVIEGR